MCQIVFLPIRPARWRSWLSELGALLYRANGMVHQRLRSSSRRFVLGTKKKYSSIIATKLRDVLIYFILVRSSNCNLISLAISSLLLSKTQAMLVVPNANLCHRHHSPTTTTAERLLNERVGPDSSIFRTRNMTTSNMDSIPVLPGPPELLRIPSLEEIDDDPKTITRHRTKQLSDTSTLTTRSSNKKDPEASNSFEFFKRAFASNPNTAVVMPERSCATSPMSPVPTKQANYINNRRVKQISDMTEMTRSTSFDDEFSAPHMYTPPSNVSFLRTTDTDVDPNPYPAQIFSVHSDPISTGTPPAEKPGNITFKVPAVPTLTAPSFEEKEEYRSFRRSIKIRLNRMAKVHYIKSKAK